ncbi:MAG: 3'-5' exonuclease domain-containing protein 2 [Candidatus Azobacteroides sp.]|nr:3'-5' exonuclease domain-containing protein 2 [Candidatus Azobacteroides sp.]
MNGLTITKDELNTLPVETFDGNIIVVQTEEEAIKAIEYLKEFSLIGFDTETKPSFRKGNINRVALLQLSTLDTCFLFRLNRIGFIPPLINLLSDSKIKKIGLSLKDDFDSLNRWKTFKPKGFIDIQNIISDYHIHDKSLQKIYAILFKKKISKRQRLSNWENDILTDAQKKYAAIDAWACCMIYNELMRLNEMESF